MPKAKQQLSNDEIVGKESGISVKLGELFTYHERFQRFMLLPKPVDLMWELSFCFNTQILPALENYQKVRNDLIKQFGASIGGGNYDVGKASDENKIAFAEATKKLGEQPVVLNIERVSGGAVLTHIKQVNERIRAGNVKLKEAGQPELSEVEPTDEMMIPFLFVK